MVKGFHVFLRGTLRRKAITHSGVTFGFLKQLLKRIAERLLVSSVTPHQHLTTGLHGGFYARTPGSHRTWAPNIEMH